MQDKPALCAEPRLQKSRASHGSPGANLTQSPAGSGENQRPFTALSPRRMCGVLSSRGGPASLKVPPGCLAQCSGPAEGSDFRQREVRHSLLVVSWPTAGTTDLTPCTHPGGPGPSLQLFPSLSASAALYVTKH